MLNFVESTASRVTFKAIKFEEFKHLKKKKFVSFSARIILVT